MSRLTAAQDGALLELSRKLDDAGEGRAPKWRTWRMINALVDTGFIRPVPLSYPPRSRRYRGPTRYVITEAGRRHLERKDGKAL